MKITGRTRFRTDDRGKLVLQVEQVQTKLFDERYVVQRFTWRDAQTQDLAELHTLTYGKIDVHLPALDEEVPGGTSVH